MTREGRSRIAQSGSQSSRFHIVHFVGISLISLITLLLPTIKADAQERPSLSLAEKSKTIEAINEKLRENYVYPDIAEKMAQALSSNLKSGKYSPIELPAEFAQQLTRDAQSISHDKHLRIVYDPQQIAVEKSAATTEAGRASLESELMSRLKSSNFGFREMKILDNNIGYLDLREFVDAAYGRETAVAAMNTFKNADALIIDLRSNGGGSPTMIQLISSYFFTEKPVHLNSFYWRPTDEMTETWTLRDVPGVRRPDIPLYLLTSKETFSAAEEFCYNLKNLKRATIIGETTGGGAHPTGSEIATDKFLVRVPKGRAINPITGTNWEGVGVMPDISVSADQALDRAITEANRLLRK